MATLDITINGNLTNITTPEGADRFIVVDNGTATLQDMSVTDFLAYLDTLYVTKTGTITQRITPRVVSEASNATPSIDSDVTDIYRLTAMAAAVTSITVTGTPTHGQRLILEFMDNATARAITHGASFRACASLATTTTISKLLRETCMWDSVDSKWDVVGVIQEQ